jgi:DNA-directed RNA polymerase specialized sigma24 family protein
MTEGAAGEPTLASLLEQHYGTLRLMAAKALRDRASVERMSPTSLVAESVVRMLQQRNRPIDDDHLRGLATVFMARVLADHAKARMRLKRGAGRNAASLDAAADDRGAAGREDRRAQAQLQALIEREALLSAMQDVAETLPRPMEVMTLHLVAGIPLARVAELVGVSERTASRDLDEGRAALAARMRERPGKADGDG